MSDHTVDTEDGGDETPQGRFVLITGPGADEVGNAVASMLPKAASVDGSVVAGMFTAADHGDLEQLYLRFTAGIALADSFRLAGFDAVVAEDVPEEHLEAYLDFASPTPVHLVRLDAAEGSRGVALAPGEAQDTARRIVERLDEAVIVTSDEEDRSEPGSSEPGA